MDIRNFLIPLLVIEILVFVHELGHYLFAKLYNVGVVKFSIGFGPALIKKQIGSTIFQLSAIPLGGFVRMAGDVPELFEGHKSDKELLEKISDFYGKLSTSQKELLLNRNNWFINKNLWQKSMIIFGGPLANIILAFLISLFCFYMYDTPINEPLVGKVAMGSPAFKAGIKPGSRILSIDGKSVKTWRGLAKKIKSSNGATLSFEVEESTSGKKRNLKITPAKQTIDELTKIYLIGISPSMRNMGIGESLISGLDWCFTITKNSMQGFWGMVTGKVSKEKLAGPIQIFKIAGQQVSRGVEPVLWFVALLSLSLAILNLLPIPVLDGGHLMLFSLEAIFGSMSVRKRIVAQQMGMAILLAIMCIAITNDLMSITGDLAREQPLVREKPKFSWEEETQGSDSSP